MRERAGAVGRTVRARGVDRQHVRRRVVGERDLGVVDRDRERDVGAVEGAAEAVVLVPVLVDRHLRLVRARRQRRRLERVDAVAVRVLEPRAQAAGIPVARAAELRLEAAGGGRDHGAPVVGRPVGLVVVVELDASGRGQARRDVAAVQLRVQAVVLVPGVVERGLVLVAAGREGEGALPDVVGRVVGEVRRGAGRIPVAGAAGLRLQRPRDRDRGRIGRRRRGGEQDEPGGGKRDHQSAQHPHSCRLTRVN